MRLGLILGLSGAHPRLDLDMVLEAERLGYHSVWTHESYSTDAVSPAAWVLARTTRINVGTGIMQMPARTPACAAATALTLQALSGNRFLCGIGPSGPQVIEGWHGVPFGKPLERTREYIAIIRKIVAREAPVTHQGEHYQIPYTGPGASGLGKPLRSIIHGDPNLKIYTATASPGGLRLAGEVADGTLPFFMSPEQPEVVLGPIREGRNKAGKPASLADFDLAPYVRTRLGDDVAACRDAVRPELALYIGGMGARAKNYYNEFARRLGYEAAATKIQDLYLAGQKKEAEAAVPDKLIDEICLLGPPARIKDRLRAWRELSEEHGVGTLILSGASRDALRVVAEAAL